MENIKNCILEKVEVIGMWGKKDISTTISNINIFIGYNGSGKTTFINIIEAVLSADLAEIARLKFQKCTLHFSKKLKIICEKKADNVPEEHINYRAVSGQKKLMDENLYDTHEGGAYFRKILMKYYNEQEIGSPDVVKKFLNNVVCVSWLSVDRKIISIDEFTSSKMYTVHSSERVDIVNSKLNDLIDGIQKYKSKIETKERELLDEFRKKVFELMLYKEELDSHLKSNLPKDNKWIGQLKKAFNDLGLERLENKIENHVKAVREVFAFLKNPQESNYDGNLAGVLTLFNRTMEIVALSKDLEAARKIVREYFEIYISKLDMFINKKIEGIHDAQEGMELFKPNTLSSGEKQIVILLSEILLQENKNVLFIADEPELSLHIDWQKEIIGAMHELNKNAQLIFATHSPEIVSKWKNNVINMANITRSSCNN